MAAAAAASKEVQGWMDGQTVTKSGKGTREGGLNKREEILSQEKAWH